MPGSSPTSLTDTRPLGAERVIQRPHFGRDIGGRHEMRALAPGRPGDRHMLIGGQHRNGDIAGLQGRRQRLQRYRRGCRRSDRPPPHSLFDRAVPHHNLMAVLDQPPQARAGGQARAAPMNCHARLSLQTARVAVEFRLCPTPNARIQDRPSVSKRRQQLRRIILDCFRPAASTAGYQSRSHPTADLQPRATPARPNRSPGHRP